MALVNRNLKSTRVLKSVVNFQSEHQEQALFAASAAAITAAGSTIQEAAAMIPAKVGDLLPPLTPLYFDTAATPPAYKVWTNGQEIAAFVIGLTGLSLGETGMMKISDAGETIGLVVKGGKIPYDQIPLPPGETDTNLKNALRDGMRARGYYILNLDAVH